jgi:transposase
MSTKYSQEFKLEAVKQVVEGKKSAAQVARELGVNENTMRLWVQLYRKDKDEPFVGSGNLHSQDKRIRDLEKRIKDLEEENEILKKAAAIFVKNRKN